jgi:hypothetical protein
MLTTHARHSRHAACNVQHGARSYHGK